MNNKQLNIPSTNKAEKEARRIAAKNSGIDRDINLYIVKDGRGVIMVVRSLSFHYNLIATYKNGSEIAN